MTGSSNRSKGGGTASFSLSRSAVRRAVHSVFDDLRRDAVSPEGSPFLATLAGMSRSGRTSAATSYVLSRAAQDAIERGMFPAGTSASEVRARQELVVDIAVRDLLNSMPPNIVGEAVCQPAPFLRRTSALVRRGTTELVLLDGFDELLRRTLGAVGNSMTPAVAIGVEAARGFARTVGTPVVHICDPTFREKLTQEPIFCRAWRWEMDMFCMDDDEDGNPDYMLERFHSLGLSAPNPSGYPIRPDPSTGFFPAMLFSASGDRMGAVSPTALAEALKSCGAGSCALILDVRESASYAALVHFEPTARLTRPAVAGTPAIVARPH